MGRKAKYTKEQAVEIRLFARAHTVGETLEKYPMSSATYAKIMSKEAPYDEQVQSVN